MTRFYLQLKEDPHGSVISIFVSNLPISYSQRQYAKILEDIIGKGKSKSKLDVCHYKISKSFIYYSTCISVVACVTAYLTRVVSPCLIS